MKYRISLSLILLLCPIVYGASSDVRSRTKPLHRIYEMGGRELVDGSLEATGIVQADRYYEIIGVSTPTVPSLHHARLWLNTGTRQFCTEFDDGSITCLGSGGTSGLSLHAIEPIVYNSTTSTLSLEQVALGTGTVGSYVGSVIGTVNQVNVNASSGTVTFSTPQDISTFSFVQFGQVTVGISSSVTTCSPTLVQSVIQTPLTETTSGPLTITPSISGNFIVIFSALTTNHGGPQPAHVHSITDNKGNIYNATGLASEYFNVGSGFYNNAELWYSTNTIGGITTITITYENEVSRAELLVQEYSGVGLIHQGTHIDSGSGPSTGPSLTASSNNSLFLTVLKPEVSPTDVTSPWTFLDTGSYGDATYIEPVAGTEQATFIPTTSNLFCSAGAVFNPAGTCTQNNGIVFNDLETTPKTIKIIAPTVIGTSYINTLPISQGATNSFLQNDGLGNLTWASSNTMRGYLSATEPVKYNSVTGVIGLEQVSLSSGVTSFLPAASIASGSLGASVIASSLSIAVSPYTVTVDTANNLGQKVSLSTGVVGILPAGNLSGVYNITADTATNLISKVSLSSGVMNILSISTQTNLTASGAAVLSGSNIGVGQISLSTGVTGTLPEGNITHTFTSSVTFNNAITISSVTGAGLGVCGDSTHALGFTSTNTFTCQNVTGSGSTGSGYAVEPATVTFNLAKGVKGTTTSFNAFDSSTSSFTVSGVSGEYDYFGLSVGSATIRNIASGTQCIHADSSGNLTGTGSDCASTTGFASLSATQTFTASQIFISSVAISTNTILPGATFYQNSYILIGTSIVFSPSTGGIFGTRTNDNALGGYVGEYAFSASASNVSAATSGNYDDLVSISLTPGDWDVSGIIDWASNSATWSQVRLGISSTSGNDSTGLNNGDNFSLFIFSSGITPTNITLDIPVFRVSLTSTTTYYLKRFSIYTIGTPLTQGGRISARRVR